MVQLWVVLGLVLSMVLVSALGATFSVVGLGALFSGEVLAVWVMASGLELAKFSIAAFLHQTWGHLNILLKSYLLVAVVILSVITSMGIFGFLSNAYQQSSTILDEETIKLDSLKAEQNRNTEEIARINKALDEIPSTRVTKKMKARAEAEPMIIALKKQSEKIAVDLTTANLKIVDVKRKVGPLIYIARAFQVDLDTAVKYLIFLFVVVFDPLAICLVLVVSESFKLRKRAKENPALFAASARPSHEQIARVQAAQAQAMQNQVMQPAQGQVLPGQLPPSGQFTDTPGLQFPLDHGGGAAWPTGQNPNGLPPGQAPVAVQAQAFGQPPLAQPPVAGQAPAAQEPQKEKKIWMRFADDNEVA